MANNGQQKKNKRKKKKFKGFGTRFAIEISNKIFFYTLLIPARYTLEFIRFRNFSQK
jgi:hypothetical protein